MSVDVALNTITSGFNLNLVNENFNNIQEALVDAVSRSGNEPNQMNADLDLNSNDLLNANAIYTDQLILNGEAVSTTNLGFPGDNTVTTDKIVDGAVTADKISNSESEQLAISDKLKVKAQPAATVVRDLSDKVVEFYTILDFNPDAGTGSDDSAAFQAAFTEIASNGGVLLLPYGREYNINTTITASISSTDLCRAVIAHGVVVNWNGSSGYCFDIQRTSENGLMGSFMWHGGNYVAADTYTGSSDGYGIWLSRNSTNFEWHNGQSKCRRGNIWTFRNTDSMWSENVHIDGWRADQAYCIVRVERNGGTNSMARPLITNMYHGSIYGPYAFYVADDVGPYDGFITNIKGNTGNLAIAWMYGAEYNTELRHLAIENQLTTSSTYTGTYNSTTRQLTITTSDTVFVAGRDDPESNANVDGITFAKGSRTDNVGRLVKFTDSGSVVRYGRVQTVIDGQNAILFTGSGAADGAVTALTRAGFFGVELDSSANTPRIINFGAVDSSRASPYSAGSIGFPLSCFNGFQTSAGSFQVIADTNRASGASVDAKLGDATYGLRVANIGKIAASAFRADAYFGSGVSANDTEGRINILSGTGSAFWQIRGYNGTGQNSSTCGVIGIGFASSSGSIIAERFEIGAAQVRTFNVIPYTDNASTIGNSSFRYSVIYAATGTINTSDGTLKTELSTPSDELLDAIDSVSLGIYKYLDAIKEKGEEGARYHAGAIAQQVAEAFEAKGLYPAEHGLWCADQLIEIKTIDQDIEEDGETKTVRTQVEVPVLDENNNPIIRYGLRYEELLVLLAMAERRARSRMEIRVKAIEDRLSALEV